MKTYSIYIENKKPGVDHMVEKLGVVIADNLNQAYKQAREKFNADIYSFQHIYGMDSQLFHLMK